MALEHDLELVPILNKIDLPSAEPDRVAQEVEDVIGLPCLDAPRVSAKMGIGIEDTLEQVIQDIPAPKGDENAPAESPDLRQRLRQLQGCYRIHPCVRRYREGGRHRAYDGHRCGVLLVEVGRMGATSLIPCDKLQAGEVGYCLPAFKTCRIPVWAIP